MHQKTTLVRKTQQIGTREFLFIWSHCPFYDYKLLQCFSQQLKHSKKSFVTPNTSFQQYIWHHFPLPTVYSSMHPIYSYNMLQCLLKFSRTCTHKLKHTLQCISLMSIPSNIFPIHKPTSSKAWKLPLYQIIVPNSQDFTRFFIHFIAWYKLCIFSKVWKTFWSLHS